MFEPNPSPVQEDLVDLVQRTRDLWTDLNGARIFITGATGFFGTWLLETALYAADVLALDLQICALSRNPIAFMERRPRLALSPRVEWLQGDVVSFEFPAGNFSHVIHGGMEASTAAHASDSLRAFDIIVNGTRNVLEFASQASAARFLNLSSGAVYGKLTSADSDPVEDSHYGPTINDPKSAYAEGKRAAELLTSIVSLRNEFQAVSARCFAFVGPYQPMRSTFAIGNFISDAAEGKEIQVRSDGAALRSYMYASDLAEHLWTLLVKGTPGEAYNVGSEAPISIGELAARVKQLLNGPSFHVLGSHDGESPVERYIPDTSKIRGELSLKCHVDLDLAILKTAQWLKREH